MSGVIEAYRNSRTINKGSFVKKTYITNRSWEYPRNNAYREYLPTLNRENFLEFIESKIQLQGHIHLADFGCGQGNFLAECKRKWGENITCTGFTIYPYHLENEYLDIDSEGVQIHVMDLHFLQIKDQFDLAIGIHLFQYLHNPFLVLKKMHRSLKMGGIGIITPTRLQSSVHWKWQSDDESILSAATRFQSATGMNVYETTKGDSGVYFIKSSPHIRLPIKLSQMSGYLSFSGSEVEDTHV